MKKYFIATVLMMLMAAMLVVANAAASGDSSLTPKDPDAGPQATWGYDNPDFGGGVNHDCDTELTPELMFPEENHTGETVLMAIVLAVTEFVAYYIVDRRRQNQLLLH